MNAAVEKFTVSLETKKQHFATMRQQIQTDNNALQNSINERLSKLQEELAMESSIMDEVANKTTQLKTKSLQLT